jgi:mRNA interferase RelE/StbE
MEKPADASGAEIAVTEIAGAGFGLHWPARDADVPPHGLMTVCAHKTWMSGLFLYLFELVKYNKSLYSSSVARRVEYSSEATRTLMRIDRATSKRIREKVDLLAIDPEALANNVRALKGAEGLMRLRVGDWRVIYTADLVVLLVLKVAPRGSAYE